MKASPAAPPTRPWPPRSSSRQATASPSWSWVAMYRRWRERSSALDVAEVLTLEHPALATYTADGFTMALAPLLTGTAPTHVVMPHTYQTRDFAPMLAARLHAPLLTDVTGITGTGSDATFTRPMFQGKLAGQVRPVGTGPVFVTVQVGAFRADAVHRGGPAPIALLAGGHRCVRHPPAARAAVSGGEAGGGSRAGRTDRGRGPRDQGEGEPARRRASGRRHARRAGRVTPDLRQRLAADGPPGGQLGTDGGAQALRRAWASPAPSSTSSG